MKKILLLLTICFLTSPLMAAEEWSSDKCLGYMQIKYYSQAIICLEWGVRYSDEDEFMKNLMKGVLREAYESRGMELEDNKEYTSALSHYEKSYSYATKDEDKNYLLLLIDGVKVKIQEEEDKKNAPSNDPLSYLQYYLKALNIPMGWGKVINDNLAIVAIIDDGININHPDLSGRIWTNSNAKYGSSKIINFVGDDVVNNLPTGEHGTMIAGIIGAITNNNEGVAGIAKNVQFMPLRVFDFDGNAEETNIIKALNYAIDNGAHIINLSLGASQFQWSEKYDDVIKKAYTKGVVVVIAAGNGDILSAQEKTISLEELYGSILDIPVSAASGVNLSDNPISPVCNNDGSNQYSIGVYASDRKGNRTNWTNYGDCALFMSPGANIISTSIPRYNDISGIIFSKNYNISSGTSFSAPMITGIIALGFNQYGWVSPDIVQASLKESLVKNSVGSHIVDASKYLDALKKRLPTIQKEQKARSQGVDTTSDADILADFGIITKKETVAEYRLDNNVLRQEVIGMAMKLAGITPPTEYTCKNTFRDVSAVKPNNWVCRAVEIGVENGIVSGANKNFNPESNITRAEALAILMKAAGIKIQEGSSSKYADVTVPWQINIVNTAFSYSFIDAADSFYPNKNATRGEIFNMAKRILKSKS